MASAVVEVEEAARARDEEGRLLCCVPTGAAAAGASLPTPPGSVSCSNRVIADPSQAVAIHCSSSTKCSTSLLMHQRCFDKFEDQTCAHLAKMARCRGWSEKQVCMYLHLNLQQIN